MPELDNPSVDVSTSRVASRIVLGFVVMSVTFFGTAGTLYWIEAWIYLAVQFSFSTALAVWLKRNNPALLRDRMIFLKQTARTWDKAIVLISTVFFVPYIVLPGLDAVRYGWSAVPWPVEAAGFAGIALSLALVYRVMRENTFLSRVVEIQRDRQHRVVSTGPYRYVRHPMYVGVIVLIMCLPVALGSLWALAPGLAVALLIFVRADMEDKTLHRELEGYVEYARTVRYRLLPGVW